jgi:hypothetical protein
MACAVDAQAMEAESLRIFPGVDAFSVGVAQIGLL